MAGFKTGANPIWIYHSRPIVVLQEIDYTAMQHRVSVQYQHILLRSITSIV